MQEETLIQWDSELKSKQPDVRFFYHICKRSINQQIHIWTVGISKWSTDTLYTVEFPSGSYRRTLPFQIG